MSKIIGVHVCHALDRIMLPALIGSLHFFILLVWPKKIKKAPVRCQVYIIFQKCLHERFYVITELGLRNYLQQLVVSNLLTCHNCQSMCKITNRNVVTSIRANRQLTPVHLNIIKALKHVVIVPTDDPMLYLILSWADLFFPF